MRPWPSQVSLPNRPRLRQQRKRIRLSPDHFLLHGRTKKVMPTTINKQRVLSQLLNGTKSKSPTETAANSILSQFAYAICREGAVPEIADQAYRRLVDRFFDWNEIRVSSPREIQEMMDGLPHAEDRAVRLIRMLQEVFETTFSFDLEPLIKKGAKPAAKHLARYEASSDFAVNWIMLSSFDAPALPID